MQMNRVMTRRPPGQADPTGGVPGAQPSPSQPEMSAGLPAFPTQGGGLGPDPMTGMLDVGTLPMPPLPPPPPGTNAPLAVPGFEPGQMPPPDPSKGMPGMAPGAGGLSAIGGPPAAGDLFGTAQGFEAGGAPPDPDLLRRILAGLPGGRGGGGSVR